MNTNRQKLARADLGLRILSAFTPEEVRREIARVGSRGEGVRIMAPKGLLRIVRLEGVVVQAANILKQEMLCAWRRRGGAWGHDRLQRHPYRRAAARHGGAIAGGLPHLRRQPFGLPATARAIVQALAHYVAAPPALRCGPYTLPLGEKTYVMGIVNVTPDSFSGDGLAGDMRRRRCGGRSAWLPTARHPRRGRGIDAARRGGRVVGGGSGAGDAGSARARRAGRADLGGHLQERGGARRHRRRGDDDQRHQRSALRRRDGARGRRGGRAGGGDAHPGHAAHHGEGHALRGFDERGLRLSAGIDRPRAGRRRAARPGGARPRLSASRKRRSKI